jgi:CRISPR-associated endonuclease/helicase Cas3
LRGWIDEDEPQTSVVWRKYLPVRSNGGDVTPKEVEEFFEAAPPHASEELETETYRVVDWLLARASALSKCPRHRVEREDETGRTKRQARRRSRSSRTISLPSH